MAIMASLDLSSAFDLVNKIDYKMLNLSKDTEVQKFIPPMMTKVK